MKYTIQFDPKLTGFIIRKYTNRGQIRDTYNLYVYKNDEVDCDCFNYQKIGVCKHQSWITRVIRFQHI